MTIKSSSQHSLMQAVAHNPAKDDDSKNLKAVDFMKTFMQNSKELLKALAKKCVELVAKVRQRLKLSESQPKQ
jgi:hypothetical protein